MTDNKELSVNFITREFIMDKNFELAALATFNIGTLLLTGGVKHLIKLRASLAVLFSKKLPRKYYLDVYEKDDSEKLANSILSVLLTKKPSALLSQLRSLSSDGINAKNMYRMSTSASKRLVANVCRNI